MQTHAPHGHWYHVPTPRIRLTSTRAPRPHGTPQEQPAARSEAPAIPEALAKGSRAKDHDAVKARRPTRSPGAIGTTPPTPQSRLTSTRAPWPHGTPQEQPAARPEAPAIPEAVAKDSRAKEHDAVKARRPMPPAAIDTALLTPTSSKSKWKIISRYPAPEAPLAHERSEFGT